MTKKQYRLWEQKMIDLQSSLIAFYDRNPDRKAHPDGSFFMIAFKAGYRAGRRDQTNRPAQELLTAIEKREKQEPKL